ncbi:sensor histidine kinase [Krasilnikovia sp. MM14-A1259]|uniref:sensor histidine kinase n=1 Tax=Krasilnikovia sp. MM14-A1259 TaxID=3373539 RepID=UPI00399CEB93
MLVTVLVLVVGLGIGGAALVAALNVALLRAANAEALDTGNAVAHLVDEGSLSDPIPAPPGVQVQVVDAQNRVRAVSVGTDRLVPILYPAELRTMPDHAGRYLPGDRIGLPGRVRVVSVAAGPSHDRVRVLVARSTADLSQGVHVLRGLLLVAFPLLVGLLALVAWRLAGATLRPVEALRAGAERITGAAQGGRGAGPPQRLPVPDTEDEIHRLAVTLNDMLDRLGAARARQRAFVADAAHELRSPLTTMRTELEVAQRLPDGTDWPALADDLLTDVERLSRLVDDLLLLARSDDSATRAAPAPQTRVDLGELLGQVAARYPAVRYAAPAEPLQVMGEPDALARVVANLLDNAVRHAASVVELAVRADGAYRSITVTDDGPGIPAADRERVFDRFTRLDDARARDAGGTGLGLAIVRELVRRHGGTVTLADAGPGLLVTVRLPGD